jgi:CHAT domain-containing protein
LEVDSRKLFQKIREFRLRAVEGITLDRLFSKAYEKSLSELYEILIQPIEKEIIGKKNFIIVPHGMLHYLPFQALLSRDGKYLIESFSISYLPSATVLKYARAKNKGNRTDLFAAGNPATGLAPLPAAELEVKEVSAIFEKKLVLTGQQATKTSVKTQGPKYDLMLLSTHGEMIESNPLTSNLRFTPLEKDNGRLTVSEIFDMEIKANLVTMVTYLCVIDGSSNGYELYFFLVGSRGLAIVIADTCMQACPCTRRRRCLRAGPSRNWNPLSD